MARVPRQKQTELDIKVTITPLGQKAKEYIDLLNEKEKIESDIDLTKKELIQAFIAEGKTSIKCGVCTLIYNHVERDSIVKKE